MSAQKSGFDIFRVPDLTPDGIKYHDFIPLPASRPICRQFPPLQGAEFSAANSARPEEAAAAEQAAPARRDFAIWADKEAGIIARFGGSLAIAALSVGQNWRPFLKFENWPAQTFNDNDAP